MDSELAYYTTLLDVLERDLPYDSDIEAENIRLQAELIKNTINMRLIADPMGVLAEQYLLKPDCCRLLLRSLELLQVALKTESKSCGEGVIKRSMLMIIVQVLEDLYEFVRDYADRKVKE